jgi:LysR family transcriptional regulator, regulator of gene expression of beta-lactamase
VPGLFRREIDSGRLVRPFAIEADVGGYWLSRIESREPTAAMLAFRGWQMSAYPERVL